MADILADIDAVYAGQEPVKADIRALVKRLAAQTAAAVTFARWDGTQRITYSTSAALTTRTLSANTLYFMPFVAGSPGTATRIGIEISTGAAGNARLGIYNNHLTKAQPSTLVLDAGTIVTTSTGFLEIAISQALAAGRYWLAFVSNAGPGVRALSGTGVAWPMVDGLTTTRAVSPTRAFTYAALPSDESAQSYTWDASALPALWLGGTG